LSDHRDLEGVPFNAHGSAAQCMTADHARVADNPSAAGKPKIFTKMIFFRGRGREAAHAFGHFDEAFFAFALLAAGGRDLDAEGLGIIEKRSAAIDESVLAIKVELDASFRGSRMSRNGRELKVKRFTQLCLSYPTTSINPPKID